MVWTVDDNTVGDFEGEPTFDGATLLGAGIVGGDVVVTAEVKYLDGTTPTSFDPTISDTITITVNQVVPNYTLTVETNGGTPLIDPILIPEGALILDYLPNNPTKAGYAFAGYHSDIQLTQQYIFGAMPASNLTLYIKWNELFTVTYNLNGGNIDGVTDAIVVTNVESGTLVGAAYTGGTPVFTGNTWTTPYWVTTAIGDTDAASSPVTADVTVYAYWVTA